MRFGKRSLGAASWKKTLKKPSCILSTLSMLSSKTSRKVTRSMKDFLPSISKILSTWQASTQSSKSTKRIRCILHFPSFGNCVHRKKFSPQRNQRGRKKDRQLSVRRDHGPCEFCFSRSKINESRDG
jgi:hypothetical protein